MNTQTQMHKYTNFTVTSVKYLCNHSSFRKYKIHKYEIHTNTNPQKLIKNTQAARSLAPGLLWWQIPV